MKNTLKLNLLSLASLMIFGCGENSSTTLNSEGDANVFRFTSISPTSGPTTGGTPVTITGNLFTSNTTVQFGADLCTNISLLSSTELTCDTPANSEGFVSVTLSDGNDSETVASAFTYGTPAPTFSSVSPSSFINSQSTSVTISGAGFVGGTTVSIGGSPCSSVVVNSGSSLTCNTPTGVSAGARNIVITNPSANSATGNSAFTFRVAPTLIVLRGSSTQGAFQTCQGCHGSSGGLDLSSYSSISSRVVSGNPSGSVMWQRMEGTVGNLMPQGGPIRPAAERQALADWILDGAQDN